MSLASELISYREQPQPFPASRPTSQGWSHAQTTVPQKKSRLDPLFVHNRPLPYSGDFSSVSYTCGKVETDIVSIRHSNLEQSYSDAFRMHAPVAAATGRVDDLYVIEDRIKVLVFIEKNRLNLVLQQAYEHISSAFGEVPIKKLSMVCDDEGFCSLFCLVLFPGGVQEARQALMDFDERWWLSRSHQFAGKLDFDFELV